MTILHPFLLLLGLCLGAFSAGSVGAAPQRLTIYAAASLTDVLTDMGAAYTAKTGVPVKFSFAGSATLARQIEAGAPADLFYAADTDWMDYLQQRHLINNGSRSNLASNRLVLIAPAISKTDLKILRGFQLGLALGKKGRLAMADPDYVPAGRYARSALTSLGVWQEVADRLVRAENVRGALSFVSRGDTPLGIVYETDALADKKVRIVDVFPAASHPQILYPAALIATTKNPAAADFLQYSAGPEGQRLLHKYGFLSLQK